MIGFIRKADIEVECGLFEKGLNNFYLALRYLDNEPKKYLHDRYEKYINENIKNLLFQIQRQQVLDCQLIWIGTAIGLIVGMAFVSWDFVSNRHNSFINHPLLKLFIIGLCSFIFYYLTSLQCNYRKKFKERLLLPPHTHKFKLIIDNLDNLKQQKNCHPKKH